MRAMGGVEMDKELSRILDETIQLELNVADLYLSFSHAFSEDKDFWSQLAVEERNHAALLRSGKLESLEKGHFPAKALTTNLDALIKVNKEIKALVKEHKRKSPSRASAFEIAIKVEESTGEIDFSCFMEQVADSLALKLFSRVNSEDKDHARRLRDYMRKKGIGIPGTMSEAQDNIG
jgi:rubrerythrin